MPRRIPDYPDAYAGWNYVSSIGSLISLMSVFILFWVFFTMLYFNPKALKVKNNNWEILSYYSLLYNKLSNLLVENNLLSQKSTANIYSLEFSISSAAKYHEFDQVPIMG
jgi:heme/copper-type cytochrome/quinol oxidase subunit 1